VAVVAGSSRRDRNGETVTVKKLLGMSHCAQANCTDGASPEAGVVRAPSGNLYGTTAEGGLSSATATSGSGVVFELVK
jgi:hypothetical protein